MKHLIVGLGKSGTTALYAAVKKNLVDPSFDDFEPKRLQPHAAESVGITKMLIDPISAVDAEIFPLYDRRYLIVRDLRDLFVSRLLYRTRDTAIATEPSKAAIYVDLLRQKEADVDAVTLVDLAKTFEELSGEDQLDHLDRMAKKLVWFDSAYGEQFFQVSYEEFVAGDTRGVSEYAGFPVDSDVDVGKALGRVARTRGAGDWKNWFTAVDVEAVRQLIGVPLE